MRIKLFFCISKKKKNSSTTGYISCGLEAQCSVDRNCHHLLLIHLGLQQIYVHTFPPLKCPYKRGFSACFTHVNKVIKSKFKILPNKQGKSPVLR